jgi:enediyne biosynthesis protein E4
MSARSLFDLRQVLEMHQRASAGDSGQRFRSQQYAEELELGGLLPRWHAARIIRARGNGMRRSKLAAFVVGSVWLVPGAALAAPITFTDIARDPGSGISYRRVRSATDAIYDAIKLRPFLAFPEFVASPVKSRGQPGVALLDYDKDGDVDIYVTNGPGRANSLFQNQLKQTGQTTFIDRGVTSGAGATDQDSTGVCYGDIDNDGDEDLYVLGRMEQNQLLRNNGNGSFTDITSSSGAAAGTPKGHSSCSMGDVNGDGRLDIFVANTFDWARREAIVTQLYSFSHANDLYLNNGGNVFSDGSESSGIRRLFNVPQGDGTISWSVALVDYDLDGDVDIVHTDDQGGMPNSGFAGVDRGFLQIHKNDGTGHFSNFTAQANLHRVSASWMGLAFADLNHDGRMDMFATNLGDYFNGQLGVPLPPGICTTAWYLGQADGSFVRPDFGSLFANSFGWGTGAFDYDNDGDTDIVYYGSLDQIAFNSADNPGIVLNNDGTAALSWDRGATIAHEEYVLRQGVHGVALGDLNNDGFNDVTYASSHFAPSTLPLVRANQQWGTPLDAVARFIPSFTPIGPFEWEWSGVEYEDGFLGVQLSSASTGNKWVKIRAVGAKGLTPLAKNNRSGIGAVVKFTPSGGKTAMTPVLGGSSHASQHSLIQGFGLAAATRGTAEVLWPGGVKNRLYDVAHAETVTIPEIPCDFSRNWATRRAYRQCVDTALNDLRGGGVITNAHGARLRTSALRAYDETH